MTRSKTNRPVAVLAVTLTATLFLFGGKSVSASMFGAWHDAVHVTAYSVLALLYARALPQLYWIWIVLGVMVLGGLHELYQVEAGRHQFEFEFHDFLCNAAGAGLGSCLRFIWNVKLRE